MLIPVASVLVIERRRCSCCGCVYDAPSANIHDLLISPVGDAPAHSIQRVPRGHYPLSDRKTLFIKEIDIPTCIFCWERTDEWYQVIAERPARPRPPVGEIKVRRPPTLEEL